MPRRAVLPLFDVILAEMWKNDTTKPAPTPPRTTARSCSGKSCTGASSTGSTPISTRSTPSRCPSSTGKRVEPRAAAAG